MVYVSIAARSALLLIFLVSALTKLRSRRDFRMFCQSVRDLKLLPASVVDRAAAFTVSVEVSIVALLAVPVTAMAGFVLATGTLALLISMIVVAVGDHE